MEAQSDNEGGLSTESWSRVHSVEVRLSELDPILLRFCAANGYTFSSKVGVWPRRKLWARGEIDRCFDLTTDLPVAEVLKRGFSPAMPWSLYATASLESGPSARLVVLEVFRHLPFSELATALPVALGEGLSFLRSITAEQVIARDADSKADISDDSFRW